MQRALPSTEALLFCPDARGQAQLEKLRQGRAVRGAKGKHSRPVSASAMASYGEAVLARGVL